MKVCRRCGRLFEEQDARYCPTDGTTLSEVDRGAAPPADDTLVGTLVDGRYRVLSRLGSGGMGTVYRARQQSIDRDVAIKVMADEADELATQRFLREARTTSSLRNIHTVVVHDFGKTESNRPFLVMELLEGVGKARRHLQPGSGSGQPRRARRSAGMPPLAASAPRAGSGSPTNGGSWCSRRTATSPKRESSTRGMTRT